MPSAPTVSFRRMRDATVADFELIERNDEATARLLPERVLALVRMLAEDDGAYRISRLRHCLQAATRAERDGADDDWIVACLLHDAGDVVAPFTHGQVAAEILRPFVREEVVWTVRQHGLFQLYYNPTLPPERRRARERFADHPHYAATVDFCERWDQCSFDPDYRDEPIEHFEPLVRACLTRTPRDLG
ncbi:MAG: HD domain-containing protein [Planctomycetota bacterium]